MNYSSSWIFYINSSIVWWLLHRIFLFMLSLLWILLSNGVLFFWKLEFPHLSCLWAVCKMWFGTAHTEMSHGHSPHHLTCCWSNRGFVWLPLSIDSFFSSCFPFLVKADRLLHMPEVLWKRNSDKLMEKMTFLECSKHLTESGNKKWFGNMPWNKWF